MKVALLAGGLGTRIMEETTVKPKPMVEIGGRPILWHIMQLYAAQGFDDFVVALGYKGEVIKDYFLKYRLMHGDLHLEPRRGSVDVRSAGEEADWQLSLIDTGDKSMTGGRVRRLAPVIGNETFMLTYGDGVSNVDVPALLDFHRSHGRIATLTAVRPPERSTRLVLGGETVTGLQHSSCGEGWINGGFFVFEPAVFDYLSCDADSLESVALTRLARDGELMAYRHDGFWQCMDTVQDRDYLERLWQAGDAPWARPAAAAATSGLGVG